MNEMDHQPKTKEFLQCLSQFFKRDLISIPLVKKYPHQIFNQRCGLKAATLELDTAAYPNIEYIAGNRLSVYPVNPMDQVNAIMKHLKDDICPTGAIRSLTGLDKLNQTTNKQALQATNNLIRLSEPWAKFVQINGRDSLRLALVYLYDITTAPSRDLLRLMAESCSNKEHKSKLIAICKSDESWEKWICQSMRTLKSTLDEFSSCILSAKSLFSELTLQQPRQYSISSIKSSKRFRTEIIVFQHRFTTKHISHSLLTVKEHERTIQLDGGKARSPVSGSIIQTMHPRTVHVNHNDTASGMSTGSVRSLRSVVAFGTSPISTQQVRRVPSYSGALMSMYALAPVNVNRKGSDSDSSQGQAAQSQISLRGKSLLSSAREMTASSLSGSRGELYEGLCSSYLLNLNSNDHIVCEFVENPRFTLKGNRERPIMMIGQDVGVLAYRAFWQQRSLEHDRAQVFYTLFKDLPAKKFGDMQLVCLTGNKCKIEDLFKREINQALTNKILSTATYVNRNHLLGLLESASSSSLTNVAQTKLPLKSNELIELGNRISKLLIDFNGCLYTCCDTQMTQAIEILVVESIARNKGMARDRIMALLPKWKGRAEPLKNNNKQFLFTLENPFERAQIVQEIYDSSI